MVHRVIAFIKNENRMSVELRCVECGKAGLTLTANGSAQCANCGAKFSAHLETHSPILLRKDSPLNRDSLVDAKLSVQQGGAEAAQNHWATGELVELLESCPGKLLLNYGSGDGGDYVWLKKRDYEVTTFDVYPGHHTQYISDGHNLCFADGQFDIVTSIAVFEHLYDPFAAAREIFRVLKPGGALVGGAAFLEPFHAQSYFHMTHLGITEVLRQAGFSAIAVYPGWTATEAISSHLWPLMRIRPLGAINGAYQRLCYRFALWQWKMAYRLHGKPIPPEFEYMFCGSILFKAEKPRA
jgi:SAM-dependent methyltransferase